MAAKQTRNVFSAQHSSGVAFVGTILIGVAIGMFKNNVAPFSVLGVGVGFLLVAVISLSTRNNFSGR